jgi:hypothetical protein
VAFQGGGGGVVLVGLAFELRGALLQLEVRVDGVGEGPWWSSMMTCSARQTAAQGAMKPATGEEKQEVRGVRHAAWVLGEERVG